MIKKILHIIILNLIFISSSFAQKISGQFIELTKQKNEIKIPDFNYSVFYIESDQEKIDLKEGFISPPYEIKIQDNGKFQINTKELKGGFFTIYFVSERYAYLILRNISKSELGKFLNILPAIKNEMKSDCGPDCFTVDEDKTYKRKEIKIDHNQNQFILKKTKNPYLSSQMQRKEWFIDSKYYYEYK